MKNVVVSFILLVACQAFGYQSAQEISAAVAKIQANFLPNGAVLASPSKTAPDYYYHWTRDAGLTMGTLVQQFPGDQNLAKVVRQWAAFERTTQQSGLKAEGVAEPKFLVTGEVYPFPWGRPQNDGPAIRTWTYLQAFGTLDDLTDLDLNYLQAHWNDVTVDLWEETHGHHFFSTYAQMAAFRLASQVAMKSGQAQKAATYNSYASQIEASLNSFVDSNRKQIVPTVGETQGVQKPAGLDISTILAVMYFGPSQNWSISNSYVLSTAAKLEQSFSDIYSVNKQYATMAPAIGRYPEDIYNGTGFGTGNAWFLSTFGMGEFYCSLAQDLARRGAVRFDHVNAGFYQRNHAGVTAVGYSSSQPEFWALVQGLKDKGVAFVNRALFHAGPDRHYSEQINRDTGFRQGAVDLTWSYASAIRAFRQCDQAERMLKPLAR